MFNPLTPTQLVVAIGQTGRDAARHEEPANEFSRGQLLSAYSISRHLAVELNSFGPELRVFAGAVAAGIRARSKDQEIADRLEATTDPREIGDAVCELLDALRADPAAAEHRAEVRALLGDLADREVELLAAAIEGPT
jgi:hypothetical protein